MDAVVEERWREERRVRLLDAAQRVFSKFPYPDASMEEIAHEAGVGKPTLYRYFSGKEELYAAVFVDALGELERRMGAVLTQEKDLSARLRGLIAALLPTFRDHLVTPRILDEEAASADQSRRRVFREHRGRIVGFIAEAIDDGITFGEARPLDPTRTAHLVIGMCRSAAACLDGSDDAVAEEVSAMVLSGLAAGGRAGMPT